MINCNKTVLYKRDINVTTFERTTVLSKFSRRFLTFVSAFLGCVWATPHGLSKLLHVYFFHSTIITGFPFMKLMLNHRKCDGPYQAISRDPNDTQNASNRHLTL